MEIYSVGLIEKSHEPWDLNITSKFYVQKGPKSLEFIKSKLNEVIIERLNSLKSVYNSHKRRVNSTENQSLEVINLFKDRTKAYLSLVEYLEGIAKDLIKTKTIREITELGRVQVLILHLNMLED